MYWSTKNKFVERKPESGGGFNEVSTCAGSAASFLATSDSPLQKCARRDKLNRPTLDAIMPAPPATNCFNHHNLFNSEDDCEDEHHRPAQVIATVESDEGIDVATPDSGTAPTVAADVLYSEEYIQSASSSGGQGYTELIPSVCAGSFGDGYDEIQIRSSTAGYTEAQIASSASRDAVVDDDEEEEDMSSGFGSGGGMNSYDNLSGVGYGSIGEEDEARDQGGVGIGGGGSDRLIIDPGVGLMLEEDDFANNVDDDGDLDNPVERLLRRSDSTNCKARENVCISIPGTLHQVMNNAQDIHSLMLLFHKLAKDPNQSVRIELMEQVPQLAALCHEFPEQLEPVMTDELLPLTLDYVSNPVCQVRKTTQAALLVILEQRLLTESQIQDVCCKISLLTVEQDPETDIPRNEDDRADALALMSRMVPILGPQLTLARFLGRFIDLCSDSVCQLRKICAANYGEFTSIVGTNTTETTLLSLFINLCNDSVWEVRKACSESFMEVSSSCLPATRRDILSPIFVNLLTDESRWVRVSCYQNLGMFISTFAAPDALEKRTYSFEQDQLNSDDAYVGLDTSVNCEFTTGLEGNDEQLEQHRGKKHHHHHRVGVVAALLPPPPPQSPMPFLNSNRPHSSPLPSVNLLDQHTPVMTHDIHTVTPNTTRETDETTEEDQPQYNSFNYWRIPLPAIDIDYEILLAQDSAVQANTDSNKKVISVLEDECITDETVIVSRTDGATEDQLVASDTNSEAVLETNENITGVSSESEQHDDKDDDCIAHINPQAGMEHINLTDDCSPQPTSPRRRRRRHPLEHTEDSETPSVFGKDYLERATKPVPYSEAFELASSSDIYEASSSYVNSSTSSSCIEDALSCEVEDEEDLNTSNDSSDSEDTVIELTSLSEGLLCIDDDDNTSDAFKAGIRKRNKSDDDAKNIWLIADLSHTVDYTNAQEIAAKSKKQSVVPQSLMEQFLFMTDPRRAETEEKDISRHCAFAMPAVALTLGRENWPVLRDTYLQLAQNFQWRVRRTLAYSMHEMAAILGAQQTTADLLPLFKDFTLNEPECVRIGVLENLAQFVKVLPPAQRKALLPHMKYFFGINDRRHRQEFGRQLAQLLKLYPPVDCDEHLKLYCLILLTDNVVHNRQNVYGLISLLIERLGCEGDTCYVIGVCETLCKRFALEQTWSRRQTYVFAVGRIFADGVLDMHTFCTYLLPLLMVLSEDAVPNVRLAVAEVMTNHITNHEYFLDADNTEHNLVQSVYSRLQKDKDRDVRYFAASPLSFADNLEDPSLIFRDEDDHLSNPIPYPNTGPSYSYDSMSQHIDLETFTSMLQQTTSEYSNNSQDDSNDYYTPYT
uniref:Serine/threonine-protein phosphatase 4 regulatory subunit 1-like n=2 Tax=Hirondellea gigas TaxID=1518452 RepID=A0A2P2I1T4_9CRUS